MNAARLNRAILLLIGVQGLGFLALLKANVKSLGNNNNIVQVFEAHTWLFVGGVGYIITLVGLIALALILWWRGKSLDAEPVGQSRDSAGENGDIPVGRASMTRAMNFTRLNHVMLMLICSQSLGLYALLMAQFDDLRGTSNVADFQEASMWLFYARSMCVISLMGLVLTAVVFRWKSKLPESGPAGKSIELGGTE